MPISRSQEGKLYRQRKREQMGDEAYRKEQTAKRKERRKKQKEFEKEVAERRANGGKPKIVSPKKIPPKPTIKAPPPPYPKFMPDGRTPTGAQKLTINDLINKIWEYKKKIKYVKLETVKQQFRKVENIHKKMKGKKMTGFDWLKDTDNVISFIRDKRFEDMHKWRSENSKNSQLQAIASILSTNSKYAKEYKIYSDDSIGGRHNITKESDKNLLSEKEAKNILPWSDIKKIKPTASISGKSLHFDKALISMYVLLPPRRLDIGTLKIYEKGHVNPQNQNMILVDGAMRPIILVYVNYKTSKFYGTQKIVVPKQLADILQSYILNTDLESGDFLFGDVQNFSEVITRVFKKYTNKNITVNLLRHSYLSNYLSKPRSIKKRKNIAKLMGNSVAEQNKYIRMELTK